MLNAIGCLVKDLDAPGERQGSLALFDSALPGRHGAVVDEPLDEVFRDLEQQAAGLARSQRDADLAELARAEYAEVELASRLHASPGCTLTLDLRGAGQVAGTLLRVGAGWCTVGAGQVPRATGPHRGAYVVRLGAVVALRGVSRRAVPPEARPVTARLGLGSVLREAAQQRPEVTVALTDGSRRAGSLARVGADFAELAEARGGPPLLVPFAGIAWVRQR